VIKNKIVEKNYLFVKNREDGLALMIAILSNKYSIIMGIFCCVLLVD
jgi:hypothetical protein